MLKYQSLLLLNFMKLMHYPIYIKQKEKLSKYSNKISLLKKAPFMKTVLFLAY